MKRIWLVALVSIVLSGCVLYPTTRDYYKPVVKQGQSPAISASCGYHKAKYDGLEQQYAGRTVRVYPTRDDENAITVIAVMESTHEENHLVHTQVVTDSGALMTLANQTKLTSKYLDSEGVYRSWYETKYPPLKVTPEQMTIMVTDEGGKRIEFSFEHALQNDIYYSSINC
ncbi:hypothetical protein [Vibrio atypicus]|jgi:hypothetical protein|uniref:hypothetical protein n=1 Tax=Vibrio atypicus TaxID=558271 RepID=UPI0013578603|nr:hypothetical protein [Vibrio atypicus]